jgi:hypothetical protein
MGYLLLQVDVNLITTIFFFSLDLYDSKNFDIQDIRLWKEYQNKFELESFVLIIKAFYGPI